MSARTTPSRTEPVVHVLLATCNGREYLARQWASLEGQEGASIVLHVADDGSTDGTAQLVQDLARRTQGAVRAVHVLDAAPRRSATRSFLQLLAHAVRHHPEACWFAYCDQDDVWLPAKLATACAALMRFGNTARPALYAGRTLAVDEQDRELGPSPQFRRPPCFRNALVQNILGGNTMVMNRAAAELVAAAADVDVPLHDWFTYQLVAGADGMVHFDSQPMVRYRQHGRNLVGSPRGWKARLRRLKRLWRGDYLAWNAANVAALRRCDVHLSESNRRVLGAFERARHSATPWGRARWLRRSGVFRQQPGDQLLLWAAAIVGRL